MANAASRSSNISLAAGAMQQASSRIRTSGGDAGVAITLSDVDASTLDKDAKHGRLPSRSRLLIIVGSALACWAVLLGIASQFVG